MFDPYHRWLAIPKDQRPPTHYQLLGVSPDETDPEVIQEAALRQTSHVRLYQTGPHAAQCTTVLNEIGQARAVLLNPEKRKQYDAHLPRPTEAAPPPVAPLAPPLAVPDFNEPAAFSNRRGRSRDQGGVLGPVLAFAAVLLVGAVAAFSVGKSAPASAPGVTESAPTSVPKPGPARSAAQETPSRSELRPTLDGHETAVRALAVTAEGEVFSAGGSYAAGTEGDAPGCAVRRWNLGTGNLLKVYPGHTTPVLSLAVSADGQKVLTGSGGYAWRNGAVVADDCTVRLWDVKTGELTVTFTEHAAPVRGVAFLPDGKKVLSCSSDGMFCSWSVENPLPTVLSREMGPVECLVVSPRGRFALLGGSDGQLHQWDLATRMEVGKFQRMRAAIHAVAFSPDGKQFVTGGGKLEYRGDKPVPAECVLRVFDLDTGELKKQLTGHTAPVLAVAWSSEGIASGGLDGVVCLHEPARDKPLKTLKVGSRVNCVAFAPGKRLLAGTQAGTIPVIDLVREGVRGGKK